MPTLAPRVAMLQPSTKHHMPQQPSRQARRALATNSAGWRRLRAAKLATNPWCECCSRKGCKRCSPVPRPAQQVDHVDGDSHNNDMVNLQALCPQCHSYKTATENHGFGNAGRT